MIISLCVGCCDSNVEWHSSEWYLRSFTCVCLLDQNISFLCIFSTSLLEKDKISVYIICVFAHVCTYSCLCASKRGG